MWHHCQSRNVSDFITFVIKLDASKTYPKVAYLYFMMTLASSFGELGLLPSFNSAFKIAVKTLSLASSG